jgi:hypothetical protein
MIEKSGVAAFDAQCIPTAEDVLGLAEYKAFLQQRRERIAARLNEFLGTSASLVE